MFEYFNLWLSNFSGGKYPKEYHSHGRQNILCSLINGVWFYLYFLLQMYCIKCLMKNIHDPK